MVVTNGINGIDIEGLASSKAPINHASSDSTYGTGSSTTYGHVKVTDALSDTQASSGVAASPKMVKGVKDELSNPSNVMTFTGAPAVTGQKNMVGAAVSSGTLAVSGNNNIIEIKSDGTATVSGSQQMAVSQVGSGAILTAQASSAMSAIYLDANTESDVYGTGNAVAGTILGSGAINVTGNGCSAFGYAQDNSALQTEGWGNVAVGAAAAGGAVEARGKGTFVAGQAAGGLLRTDSAANGAVAMGYALDNSLVASGNGSIAIGMADSTSPLAATAEASITIGRGINNTIANCMVVGHYPRMAAITAPTLTANNSTSTETVFAVGCGSKTNPINGLRVTQYGSIIALRSYSTSGADYAELFEWEDGNINGEDRVGKLVTLSEDKIKLAEEGDWILGIVSPAPAVLGNVEADVWRGMYQRDVYGREAYDDGSPVISTDYDPNQTYVPRMDRKEWSAVGLVGQLVCDDDGTCIPNRCISAVNGIATFSDVQTNVKCMRRVDETHVLAFIR